MLRAVSREAGCRTTRRTGTSPITTNCCGPSASGACGELALLMEKRVASVPASGSAVDDAWARLTALGASYVEFATTETGWFRTAFSVPPSMHTLGPSEGVGDSGLGPYELLGQRLDELVEVGAMPAERRPGAEYAAWSSVHGLSTLLDDGPLRDLPAEERGRALDIVLVGTSRGSFWPSNCGCVTGTGAVDCMPHFAGGQAPAVAHWAGDW